MRDLFPLRDLRYDWDSRCDLYGNFATQAGHLCRDVDVRSFAAAGLPRELTHGIYSAVEAVRVGGREDALSASGGAKGVLKVMGKRLQSVDAKHSSGAFETVGAAEELFKARGIGRLCFEAKQAVFERLQMFFTFGFEKRAEFRVVDHRDCRFVIYDL